MLKAYHFHLTDTGGYLFHHPVGPGFYFPHGHYKHPLGNTALRTEGAVTTDVHTKHRGSAGRGTRKKYISSLIIGVKRLFERICRRSEEHTSELQSQSNLVCRLLLEKK